LETTSFEIAWIISPGASSHVIIIPKIVNEKRGIERAIPKKMKKEGMTGEAEARSAKSRGNKRF
jgi:hypothetical protein